MLLKAPKKCIVDSRVSRFGELNLNVIYETAKLDGLTVIFFIFPTFVLPVGVNILGK